MGDCAVASWAWAGVTFVGRQLPGVGIASVDAIAQAFPLPHRYGGAFASRERRTVPAPQLRHSIATQCNSGTQGASAGGDDARAGACAVAQQLAALQLPGRRLGPAQSAVIAKIFA